MGLIEGIFGIAKAVIIDTPLKTFENIRGTLTEGENPFDNMGYDLADAINDIADKFNE